MTIRFRFKTVFNFGVQLIRVWRVQGERASDPAPPLEWP